jgi:uncharacterized protein YndB with AHSA1/START domain
MILNNETNIEKTADNKLLVTRAFEAPVERVWEAWTDSSILDQWWAPLPWKARTKSMDFKEGGRWLYAMIGPNGEEHWSFMDYATINAPHKYTSTDGFCDAEGNISKDMPVMQWQTAFAADGSDTVVTVELTFASPADLEKIVEMGFKEGFSMAHDNLAKLLAKK